MLTNCDNDNRPLNEDEQKNLLGKIDFLASNIQLDKMLDKLINRSCINHRHKSSVMKHVGDNYEMNDAFLWILRRRSCNQYKHFIECLRETGQTCVADMLEKKGGNIWLPRISVYCFIINSSLLNCFSLYLQNRNIYIGQWHFQNLRKGFKNPFLFRHILRFLIVSILRIVKLS